VPCRIVFEEKLSMGWNKRKLRHPSVRFRCSKKDQGVTRKIRRRRRNESPHREGRAFTQIY